MHRKILSFLFTFFFISFFFFNSCSNNPIQYKTVKFIIILNKPVVNQKVYLTGNVKEFGNWNPSAVLMDKEYDTKWIKSFSLKENEKIEFKITKGSWLTEAVNEDGWLYNNFTLVVKNDTIIKIIIPNWRDGIYSRIIKPVYFKGDDPGLRLINNWKYHPGDNKKWADENFYDTLWETISSDLLIDNQPKSGWNNVGWFRTHFKVDSALWGKTYAFLISQLGASEIYLNGKLLDKFGSIGRSYKDYRPIQNRLWKELRFDKKEDQVIAVRYANYSADYLNFINFAPGFTIIITNLNTALKNISNDTRSSSVHEMTFTLIPLILFLFHLTLYIFYRKQKQNLFYAFCLLGFAGLTYFKFEKFIITDPSLIVFYYMLDSISAVVTIFFGSIAAMSIMYEKLPKYWRYILAFGVIIIIIGFVQPVSNLNGIFIYIYFGVAMAYSLTLGLRKNNSKTSVKKSNQKGTWIIFYGFMILNVFIVCQILIDYSVISPLFGIDQVFVYGMLGLAISMSIYLAYNFAYVNKDLELQLNNVKQLSEKALEQERLANKLELERRVIDIGNKRKTKELEDARELQLSLLPKSIPKVEHLDIACFMKTAAEVGGDYYDFFNFEKDKLTIVTGDATGHGLKAGNMVIVTKGLLNILSGENELTEIMKSSNKAIKKMNLYMLTMCLAALRIQDHKLEYSSAGMPPLLIFRKATGEVEQFIIKAMPLGAFYDFPYEKIETTISKGDIVIMMSDGLTELFNLQNEIYGLERVVESLKEFANKSSEEIVNYIFEKSKSWSHDLPLKDDMTIIAIKILH